MVVSLNLLTTFLEVIIWYQIDQEVFFKIKIFCTTALYYESGKPNLFKQR